jgi:hypothetical protein
VFIVDARCRPSQAFQMPTDSATNNGIIISNIETIMEQSKSCQQTVSHWLAAKDIIVQRTHRITLREMSAKLELRKPADDFCRDFYERYLVLHLRK